MKLIFKAKTLVTVPGKLESTKVECHCCCSMPASYRVTEVTQYTITTGSFHLRDVNCFLFYDAQRSSPSHSRRDSMQLLMYIVLIVYSNLEGRADLR